MRPFTPLLALLCAIVPLHAQDDIDVNKLQQLLAQSRQEKKPPTPDEQRLAKLKQVQIDRSTAGILNARLAEAREAASAKPEVEEPETENTEGDEAKPEAPPNIEREVALFARNVALSNWDEVRNYLASLPAGSSSSIYLLLIQKLSAPVAVNPPPELQAQGAKPHTQTAFLPPADFLGLASVAPKAPDTKTITALAGVIPSSPRPEPDFFKSIKTGISYFGGEDPADRLRAAQLFIEAGLLKDATPFLPSLEAAREKPDYNALNLIARHRAELWQRDRKAAGDDALQVAWEISTSFLNDQKAPAPARAEALFRALSLIPELGEKTGEDWLAKTFGGDSTEGLEILGTLGALTAQSRENPDANLRLSQLKLQHDAVQALLATPGTDLDSWRSIFTLYARQWAHEAEVTQTRDKSSARRMTPQYDSFGNVFYSQASVSYQGNDTRPIPAASLIDCRPTTIWLKYVEPSVGLDVNRGAANLFLKVKEEKNAFPLINELAKSHREMAVDLVRSMIRVWTENHNPNEQEDYRNRYFYFYGFNNRANSIPLTRSKQERNLIELAELVTRVRALDLGESFHEEFADAFISSHSKAEVWRVEAIESVFGETSALDSATLATLVERMRLNLAGLWPNPKLQQAYKTKRKDKELQEQIFHGYAAAIGLIESALEKHPKDAWRLQTQLAALRFEESNYRSTIAPKSDHSLITRRALDELGEAAAAYTATLPRADEMTETTAPFETWFFAALGSPSLEALKAHHLPSPDEIPKIKAALDALPEESAKRHLEKFASTLNNRLANVSPDLKLRFLEAADAIVGDHETFRDASDVLAYYRDLVTEIELSATLDGPDKVAADAPFGLKINLRHTKEIERESGGFQRYLQNQTGNQYGYNFGRPPEDYRDKFEKAARAVLEETFEVISVTFHSEKVESRTDPEFGWRLTPYAYLLLKPKGPQIDRIPPLSIDLDFQDTSGYVVLPISSGEIPISASGEAAPRPFRDLRLTQTLDIRSQQEQGSAFLEVRANALGLVPNLETLIELPVPGFETGAIEDKMLQLSELDATTDDLAPLSEHEWRIELKPISGAIPATFRFPPSKVELAAEDGLVLQKYEDVDLVPVTAEVPLGVTTRRNTPLVIALLAIVAGLAALIYYLRRSKPVVEVAAPHPLPAHLTPVTLLGWLQRLRENPALTSEQKASLESEIQTLESSLFSASAKPADSANLEAIAKRWQAAA